MHSYSQGDVKLSATLMRATHCDWSEDKEKKKKKKGKRKEIQKALHLHTIVQFHSTSQFVKIH